VLLELPSGHRAAAADGGPAYYAGSYEGVFMYRLARHENVAALRLDQREHVTDGPRGIRIVSSQDYKGSCLVSAELTTTELTLAGPYEPTAGYYFIDRRTRRTLRAERLGIIAGMPGPLRVGLSPGHRIFTAARSQWNVENPRDGSPGDISPCSDTDLIFVRTIAAGSLTRAIRLPEFRVQPTQDTFFRR
jgi:hypothetical protein